MEPGSKAFQRPLSFTSRAWLSGQVPCGTRNEGSTPPFGQVSEPPLSVQALHPRARGAPRAVAVEFVAPGGPARCVEGPVELQEGEVLVEARLSARLRWENAARGSRIPDDATVCEVFWEVQRGCGSKAGASSFFELNIHGDRKARSFVPQTLKKDVHLVRVVHSVHCDGSPTVML